MEIPAHINAKIEYLNCDWATFPKPCKLDTDLVIINLGNDECVEVQYLHSHRSLVLTHWAEDFCKVVYTRPISSWEELTAYLTSNVRKMDLGSSEVDPHMPNASFYQINFQLGFTEEDADKINAFIKKDQYK